MFSEYYLSCTTKIDIHTEVRCQESSKGGMSFELRLADPVVLTPPKRPLSPPKIVSVADIEEKLKAAEDRRKSLTASQVAILSAKLAKIEDARKKYDEQEKQFIQQTEEALKQKIASYEENRESHINDLKAKLKEHLEGVEKTRLNLEQQTAEVAASIQEKLKSAANQRDENLKKMLIKLREHEEQTKREQRVEMVRQKNKDKCLSKELETNTASLV
ncbi:Stathmin, putative [Pediculus humanus corporis]|uniref:Stathmin, putative n=1 Tax=Pediculus humanus subsp. corporis TaxID=121224 RepID=E0VVN4_PEDHC|nr:Stathmin, putative [Pediculus humanus corporis]EEB17440.1 Stathmin, putative [Pediculus humanus corporis]